MKIANIKDPHFRFGRRISTRLNYSSDIQKKISFMLKYLKEHNIDTICIPGDLFDESYSKNWSSRQILDTVTIMLRILEDFTLITVPGNHDYIDGIESSQYTVYGMLELLSQRFQNVSKKFIEYDDTIFTGIGYTSNLDIVRNFLESIPKFEKPVVCLLHQNVTPNPVRHITEFSYEELSSYNVDIYLLGHYHIGYEPQIVNDTLFVNPWNFTRVARDYEVKMDKHTPEFCIIDTITKEVETVVVPFTPYKEAFKIPLEELLEKQKQQKEQKLKIDLKKFLELTDSDIVKTVGKEHNFSDIVISKVLQLLV